ncbi:hypothetical protein GO495_27105 [Chitinophaga oryziterrae]|uniref:Carboxypeptidase regulatory-like domain-containing protein n=1 Tax=Chitinophaga oryziterrae TaxID=1031224 RepID=A0A6N8JGB7_9BACT|nr:carboxypeptidase-like regulatory domain-containing protein [Chitinophaga oryziterrae]MVT44293.1 hypothetical protein [Chitinophaga oryziterrae]
MKLLRLSQLLLFPILVITIWACSKNNSSELSASSTRETDKILTSIQGRVLNEQLQPVQGAIVGCGGKTAVTDANGNFLMEQVKVLPDAAQVSITKDQYLNGIRTLAVNTNSLHYVQVILQPREAAATFSAASGGNIDLPGGKLTIQPNSVLMKDNSSYKGIVDINFKFTNPESEHFEDMMPGDLRGIDDKKKQRGLQSFGIVTLNFTGQNGEVLHLDSKLPVGLLMNIPGSLQGSAPAQIALWSFNTASGYWEQQGFASKQGNAYIAMVKSTGFWHFAVPYDVVALKATILDQHNHPIPNMQMSIVSKIDFIPVYSYTDAGGRFTGKVASNSQLILSLINPCGQIFYHQEIGPYSTDATIEPFTVPLPGSSTLMIDGIANNCSDQPVMGKINILVDGLSYATDINKGYFKMTFMRCNASAANVTFSAMDTATHINTITTLKANNGTITPSLVVCKP